MTEKMTEKAEKKAPDKKKGVNSLFVGKRKRAIARTSIKPGTGLVFINSKALDSFNSLLFRMRIREPLDIAGNEASKFNYSVNVHGGGVMGQAEAIRQSIAKGLVELLGPEMRTKFINYDRNLIVYDPRRTEPHKPPRSSQGPRRYKQRSKR